MKVRLLPFLSGFREDFSPGSCGDMVSPAAVQHLFDKERGNKYNCLYKMSNFSDREEYSTDRGGFQ